MQAETRQGHLYQNSSKEQTTSALVDGVPSRNGKHTDISKNTHNTAVLQENEPNMSDTTGACKSLKSQATHSLSHGINKAVESTTPSTAAKQIVGGMRDLRRSTNFCPATWYHHRHPFRCTFAQKRILATSQSEYLCFNPVNPAILRQSRMTTGHRSSASSVHSVRNEGVGEIEKGTNDDSKQLPKEESKKSRKGYQKGRLRHTIIQSSHWFQ